jgi:hypothetical protein
MGICKQITLLVLYQGSSRLVTQSEPIYLFTELSNVLVLIACFKFINSEFQIFRFSS